MKENNKVGNPNDPLEINVSDNVKVSDTASIKVWLSYSFAPHWFQDALTESKLDDDFNARRREILYAVCFAESYLVEWVRDAVLEGDFDKLSIYFPPGMKKGVCEKWKSTLKNLHKDGLISSIPDFSQKYWQDFSDLFDMRNGLVHARASRPFDTPYSRAREEKTSQSPVTNRPRSISAVWVRNRTNTKTMPATPNKRPSQVSAGRLAGRAADGAQPG